MSSESIDRIFGTYFRWFVRCVCLVGIIGLILHFFKYEGAEMFNRVCFFGVSYALVVFGLLAEIAVEALREKFGPQDGGWDNDNWWTPPEDDPPPDRPRRLSRRRPSGSVARARRVRERAALPL